MRDLVLGMAHRGRLNVLANIFRRPLANMFAEFTDNLEFGFVGEGDVKYHKGFSTDRTFPDGARIHLTMTSNPSHLEAVDPVVEGKCRARQEGYGQGGTGRVLPLLIHGDAAFAGQGMVAETLNLSQLDGYGTGGTLHMVLNNQIGFTTVPEDARSTRYATDVAKMLAVPIFHVHGEDPEAVLYAAGLAFDYRQRFGRDVVMEVICYRRQGHNEGDEPYFTQPLMYEAIKERPPLHEIYAGRLQAEGVADAEHRAPWPRPCSVAWKQAAGQEVQLTDMVGFQGKWRGIERDWQAAVVDTGVEEGRLRQLMEELTAVPDGFSPIPRSPGRWSAACRRCAAARRSTGRAARRSPLPPWWRRVPRCASPARTRGAAPSASDTPCSSTSTPAQSYCPVRAGHRRRRPPSASTTACFRRPRSSVSSTAIPWRRLTASPCGKRSSAISPTAPR